MGSKLYGSLNFYQVFSVAEVNIQCVSDILHGSSFGELFLLRQHEPSVMTINCY